MSYVQSVVTLEGRSQIQITGGAFQNVETGVYDVWAATDTYISVVPMSYNTAPTSTTGYFIPAGGIVSVRVGRDGLKMGASAATSIHKVE